MLIRTRSTSFYFLCVYLILLVQIGAGAAGADELPAKDRIVVMITVDGFPAWIWNDPYLAVPNLRKLAANGATANAMKVSNPSVTWPNHTTLVTGVPPAKHGVLYNGLLTHPGTDTPPVIAQWRDKKELVRVPTVYDLAFQAGLTTAHVDWIPTTNATTFNWDFPERPNPQGVIEQEMVKAGIVSAPDVVDFNKRNPQWRDMVWTDAAAYIVKAHKPNFILFHLLNTDATNHKYGPGTWASYTAYAYADSCIRVVMDAVEAAGLKDRATFFIVTDHGFKTAKRSIQANVVLRKAGLLKTVGPMKVICDAYTVAEGGSAMVYITDPAKRIELAPKVKSVLAGVEGIAQVVEPADYHAFGYPTPKENNQSPDFLLFAKPDYSFSASANGDLDVVDLAADAYKGNHGYINTDPQLDGIFIASGYGISPGARLDHITNLDVAPTVAKVLGLQMPNVDGRVLTEILK